MPTKQQSTTKRRRAGTSKPNLGQKEAELEKAAKEQMSHMEVAASSGASVGYDTELRLRFCFSGVLSSNHSLEASYVPQNSRPHPLLLLPAICAFVENARPAPPAGASRSCRYLVVDRGR